MHAPQGYSCLLHVMKLGAALASGSVRLMRHVDMLACGTSIKQYS